MLLIEMTWFSIQRLVYNKFNYNECPLRVSLSFAISLSSLYEVTSASFIVWPTYFVLGLPLDRVRSADGRTEDFMKTVIICLHPTAGHVGFTISIRRDIQKMS